MTDMSLYFTQEFFDEETMQISLDNQVLTSSDHFYEYYADSWEVQEFNGITLSFLVDIANDYMISNKDFNPELIMSDLIKVAFTDIHFCEYNQPPNTNLDFDVLFIQYELMSLQQMECLNVGTVYEISRSG